jgi:RNA polymerase sigma-70 factor (ECF subfamily)
MAEDALLAERFERYRGRLTAVASRMLGSRSEAEDAVQETWFRFCRSDTSAIRARRRVRGQEANGNAGGVRQARLVEAFLTASRRGDFSGLLALLDPDVVLRADETAVKLGAGANLRGATEVAAFSRRAGGARLALVNGQPGAVWMPGGKPRVVLRFAVSDTRITGIDLTANRESLSRIDLVVVEEEPTREQAD